MTSTGAISPTATDLYADDKIQNRKLRDALLRPKRCLTQSFSSSVNTIDPAL